MHDYPLILTLTGGLTGALLLGYITQRIGLSPIVGYLLAGTLVGPYTPGFVADAHIAEALQELYNRELDLWPKVAARAGIKPE
mgnify:CR=1 FL=1